MFHFKPNNVNSNLPSNDTSVEELEQLQKMTVADVISTATSNITTDTQTPDAIKVDTAETADTQVVGGVEIEIEDDVNEDVVITDKQTIGDKMEVKMEDIKTAISSLLSDMFGKKPEITDVQADAGKEGVETMTNEVNAEALKIQEDLKLANDKAEQAEAKALEVEAKNVELQKQIDDAKAESEAKAVEARKAELTKTVTDELSFVGGTVEDNVEKLFEIENKLGEDNAELFTFIVDSLKKTSTVTEDSLDEVGANTGKDTLSVEEQADQLTLARMEEKGLSEAKAYAEVLEENPELKKAIYGNIAKSNDAE